MTFARSSISPPIGSLAPLLTAVFFVCLMFGAALPALPLHIYENLGFGTFVIGVVSGTQFAVALVSRLWSGTVADRHGPKYAVVVGVCLAASSGVLYLLSLTVMAYPLLSVAFLLIGRGLMGGAESFMMIGAQSWCLAVAGPGNAGKMIGWIGTALFVGMAAGAPLGSLFYLRWEFDSIGYATVAGSVASLLLVMRIPEMKPVPQGRKVLSRVFSVVWLPGAGLALAGVGYATMTAFSVLFFVQRGWEPAWLSFTAFAAAIMLARVFFGSIPDRLGGARTAMICLFVHSAGMALIWFSETAFLGFVGAAVAGFGYAFIFPAFGIEAVSRAPPESRGMAMGIYSAFVDLSLGVFAPLLGLVAKLSGLGTIFMINALVALCAVPIAIILHLRR